MTILVCNNVPDAIRGLLKRWFVEPRPNVFVSSLNTKTRIKTLNFIQRNSIDMGILMITDSNNSQGFLVEDFGKTKRQAVNFSGHYLIAEKERT